MPFKFNPFTQKPDIVDVTTIPPGTVSGIIGNTGGSVPPDGSGDITILGNGDISVVGSPGANTLSIDYNGDPIDFLAGNTGGNIGPNGSGVVEILGGSDISVTGASNALTIDFTGAQEFPITQYVVGPDGKYSTISAAITAATGTGSTIYIQPGTYTENINFNTAAVGLSFVALHDTNLGNGVILSGQHNPPLSGNTTFQGIYFQNSSAVTSTFTTSSAGSPNIQFINCSFDNSTCPDFIATTTFSGNIYMIGCKSVGNIQPIVSAQSGTWYVRSCDFQHSSGSNIFSGTLLTVLNSKFTGALTGNASMDLQNSYLGVVYSGGSSTGSIYNCYLSSPSLAVFAQSSTGTWNLSQCTLNSPANPVIDGSGAGVVNLGDVTFVSGANINPSLNILHFSQRQGNTIIQGGSGKLTCYGTNTSVGTNGEVAAVILKASLGRDAGILFKDTSDVLYWQIGRGYAGGGTNTRLEFLYQNTRYAYFNSSGQFRLSATGSFVDSAAAILEIVSTTSGVRFPNMTTTEKNAIANLAGNVVFDTTLGKLCVNTGSSWQTITST